MTRVLTRLRDHATAATVGALSAMAASWCIMPERHFGDAGVVVLAAEWCPMSQVLRRQAEHETAFEGLILVLPIDVRLTDAECTRAAEWFRREAPWLRLAPKTWICERVHRHVANLFSEQMVGLPSWLIDGEPVEGDRLKAELQARGMLLCPGAELSLDATTCRTRSTHKDLTPPVSRDSVAERGADIGF